MGPTDIQTDRDILTEWIRTRVFNDEYYESRMQSREQSAFQSFVAAASSTPASPDSNEKSPRRWSKDSAGTSSTPSFRRSNSDSKSSSGSRSTEGEGRKSAWERLKSHITKLRCNPK